MNEWLTITEARKRLKLTQVGLAKAVGTTDREIRRYEYHERGEGGKPAPVVIRSRTNRLLGPEYVWAEGYMEKAGHGTNFIVRLHYPGFIADGILPGIWLDPPTHVTQDMIKVFSEDVQEANRTLGV